MTERAFETSCPQRVLELCQFMCLNSVDVGPFNVSFAKLCTFLILTLKSTNLSRYKIYALRHSLSFNSSGKSLWRRVRSSSCIMCLSSPLPLWSSPGMSSSTSLSCCSLPTCCLWISRRNLLPWRSSFTSWSSFCFVMK